MTARADRTVLRWGGATHVGRVRSVNQDRYLARDDEGLWAVADGMGGHSGGEIASRIACDTLGRSFADHTVDGLVDAVERANVAVFEAGTGNPQLTGMGTTVVALAVVTHEGSDVLAIANVGDSRCYHFAQGELDQLTTDHSLVADLVREGSLSPQEAAVHPQRNIVTRVLGVYDEVPVDVFAVDPLHGDRYLLCSDGLYNEVPEHAIAEVLRRVDEPTDAAERLVGLAVDAGGRDNVTVVVVDVVDDGGRAEAASAALRAAAAPPGDAGRDGPAPSPAYSGEGDTARHRRRFRRGDTAEVDRADALAGADGEAGRGDGDHGAAAGAVAVAPARRRRLTWRVALFSVLVLALIGGVAATIQWYATSAYYVGFEGDRVAVFRGRPGGVLWIDPELVSVTDLDRERVPASRLTQIEEGVEQPTLADARRYVANVSEQAEELEPPATTTTIAATTTTTAAPP